MRAMTGESDPPVDVGQHLESYSNPSMRRIAAEYLQVLRQKKDRPLTLHDLASVSEHVRAVYTTRIKIYANVELDPYEQTDGLQRSFAA